MAFALEGVGLRYANGHAGLSDITLSARQGECLALVGPSGAGKSSLLGVLGSALAPTSGQVRLLCEPVPSSGSALRQLRSRIGMVHQAPPLPARQRVVTSVLAGKLGQWPWWKSLLSLAYPQDMAGAQQTLARLELADKLFSRCDQLSGGQLQRVGIARTLYQAPELLLADEPVSALDPTLALATVQLLVDDARARQATLVTSLHAVDLALRCFDRIVGVREGRIAFDLPAADVTQPLLQQLYAGESPEAAPAAQPVQATIQVGHC